MGRVVIRAAEICPITFMVIEGVRTAERQAELYAQGRTKPGPKVTWTLQSKHLPQKDGFGHAVDLAPISNGKIAWGDLAAFKAVAKAMLAAAAELKIKIVWGGNWDGDAKPLETGETDRPHFQLA
jgi:peptidoglycan L-alanyl-D-glutamate endopeptidase CwlK